MIKWIHRLLEPHCPECKEEAQDKSICQSCETLKHQLEIANYEKRQMLDTILRMGSPQPQSVPVRIEVPESIKSRTIPWVVRKQMLEAEDREKAKLMRAAENKAAPAKEIPVEKTQEESIAELEKELGIDEAQEG